MDTADITRKLKAISAGISDLRSQYLPRDEADEKFAQAARDLREVQEAILTRIDERDTRDAMGRAGDGGRIMTSAERDHRDAFAEFIREGMKPGNAASSFMQRPDVKEIQRRDLSEGEATEGGFLVPESISRDIVKNVVDTDEIVDLVRHETVEGAGVYKVMRRDSEPTAQWIGEEGTPDASSSEYGEINITFKQCAALTKISVALLQDANRDMGGEILEDLQEQWAASIAAAVLEGETPDRPSGITTNETILASHTLTGDDNVTHYVEAGDMIRMYADLKARYRRKGVWFFNDTVLSRILRLESTAGNYIWTQFPNQPLGTILGKPWRCTPSLDSDGAAADDIVVGFGDLYRCYRLALKRNVYIVRDPYTLAPSRVQISGMVRAGGQVVQPEALRLLKTA